MCLWRIHYERSAGSVQSGCRSELLGWTDTKPLNLYWLWSKESQSLHKTSFVEARITWCNQSTPGRDEVMKQQSWWFQLVERFINHHKNCLSGVDNPVDKVENNKWKREHSSWSLVKAIRSYVTPFWPRPFISETNWHFRFRDTRRGKHPEFL